MSTDLESLLKDAEVLQEQLTALRRELHRIPELGLELPMTREVVLRELGELGLEPHCSTKTSGVVAVLEGSKPGKTILLRADMDALPILEVVEPDFASQHSGKMHACGHDAHMTMLLGAARLLVKRRDALSGSVVFLFQPGEEGLGGAKIMLEEGLIEKAGTVDSAFAIHIEPNFECGHVESRCGALLAAADQFSLTLRGKGGHGSRPHHAVDPIPVASEIVLALQSMVTRRLDPLDPCVVTVTQFHAGTTTNVIPSEAYLEGTFRTLSETNRKRLFKGIKRVVEGIAKAHGVEAELTISEGYPITHNDPTFAKFALEVARDLLGAEAVREQPVAKLYSEDFSYILERYPGAMCLLGVRPADGEVHPVHSDRMRLNETALIRGAALHAAMAVRFLAR